MRATAWVNMKPDDMLSNAPLAKTDALRRTLGEHHWWICWGDPSYTHVSFGWFQRDDGKNLQHMPAEVRTRAEAKAWANRILLALFRDELTRTENVFRRLQWDVLHEEKPAK